MAKYFRDIYLLARGKVGVPGRDFESLARSTTALFERNLTVSLPVWRLCIFCVPVPSSTFYTVSGGIAEVEARLDPDVFMAAPPHQRNEWTLAAIGEGCERACAFWGWPREPFAAAAAAVRAANFVNHYAHRGSKWNKSRSLHAVLWCEHEQEYFRLTLIVRDKHGHELYRKQLAEQMPSEFVFGWTLGKVVWEDDRRLNVLDKLGKVVHSADLYNA